MIKKYVIGPLDTNCYIYIDDQTGEAAVIDPAFDDENLLRFIKDINVKYIFITHAHIDHIYGINEVKKATGAKIVAHELAAKRLHDNDENLYNAFHSNFSGSGIYERPFAAPDCDITVDTGDVIEVGKTVFTVMHTPGHTSGSVTYIANKDMFCGDFLFCSSYGRIDFPSGSFADMTDSFRKICALEGDYVLHTGHQGSTTLDYERDGNPLRAYLTL